MIQKEILTHKRETTIEDIYNICMISTNGNEEVSQQITDIYKQYGLNTKVIPVTTEEYGLSKAKRPFNSRLDKSKLIENDFKPLPTWKDALKSYLQIINSV